MVINIVQVISFFFLFCAKCAAGQPPSDAVTSLTSEDQGTAGQPPIDAETSLTRENQERK